jgi:uncharacterized membrane protein
MIPARAAMVALALPLCAAVVLAPLLLRAGSPAAAAALYAALSPVCHQLPDRAFSFHGMPWAACHRCSGIYLGLAAAALAPAAFHALILRRRRTAVLLGIAPVIIDFSLASLGVCANTPTSRLVTGFLLGAILSSLSVSGIAELFARRLPRSASRGSSALGDT